jgi:predicted nucleotidyltransferase
MLDKLFSSKVRSELLNVFFLHPDRDFYVREVERISRQDHRNVVRELRNLEAIGLLKSRRQGNLKYYGLNTRFPIYDELKSIVQKTSGAVPLLRETLAEESEIDVAFIYGSFASGEAIAQSDVDLMVIGNVAVERILQLIREPEQVLSREINPVVYDAREIKKRLRNGDPFITNIFEGQKIMVVGTEDDVRRLAQQGSN